MRADTYSGFGAIFVVGDAFATETAGAIQDRSTERLGSVDAGVALARVMMLRAVKDVQEGRDPPHVIRRAEDNHFPEMGVMEERIPPGMTWKEYRERKGSLAWAGKA
jgi:hypothetical protein